MDFKNLISHCKEYGFIFPSSEIYDGLSAVYDYGPYGVELKNNIKEYWWKSMVQMHENIVGIDAAIFMHPKTWKAPLCYSHQILMPSSKPNTWLHISSHPDKYKIQLLRFQYKILLQCSYS